VIGLSAAQQRFKLHGVVVSLAAIVISLTLYAACARYIELRRPSELNPTGAGREFLGGLAIGLAAIGIVIGIFWIAGWYRIVSVTPSVTLVGAQLVRWIAVGAFEETFFRGYIYRFAQSWFGTWGAIAFSGLFFGFAHRFNPNATLVSSIAIAIEAGVLLASAYALTGRLWLPIGIHAGWDFAESTIFGAPDSGTIDVSLVQATIGGPALMTGGSFGPEGSLITVLVCVVVSLWFLARIAREGKAVARSRSRL